MWPSKTLTVCLGCLCVLLAAVSPSAHADTTVYGNVGGEAVLTPPANSVSGSITQILWKEGLNKAMEWDTTEMNATGYRQFHDRGHLDTSTGVMTISRLLYEDSNIYKPEINGKQLTPVRLIVLSPVPAPTVSKSCNESQCELTCEGNTTRATPVNYTWNLNDTGMHVSSGRQYTVHKSQINSLSSKFSCGIKNPISEKRSDPITISSDSFSLTSSSGPNIYMGVTVLIVLLVIVILLVAFHKWKTGMWFFEKESMPWEGDFWRRDERQRQASAANGSTAQQRNENPEEETPMTNG
ncbi:hepatic and glial cell adhesion molecule-like [Pelmatolapia mariae]|uniref:hepatic and glial cell adhesion molecule-like n=1 Tax=Pelmatolapia mariae TaxID=158779 RepID=UPI002FE63920